MRSLITFISETKYEDYLLDKLCTHCSLENRWTYGKGLDPRFTFYQSIYESLGKFDNAGKIVSHIASAIIDNFNSQELDCREDNVYFDYINININNTNNGAGSFLKLENNTIFIEIYAKTVEFFKANIDEYELTILHELLHGYEDYNRIKNGKDTIFDLLDTDYKNSFSNINSADDIKLWLSRCKYFLKSQERNAYFSRLENDVKDLLKGIKYSIEDFNYGEFKEKLKNTNIWKIYFNCFIFIEKLKTFKDENIRKIIEQKYNELYNKNKKYKDICDELNNSWRKFDSKFNQLVPKLICKNIEIKEAMAEFNGVRFFSFPVDLLNNPFEL